MRVLPLTLLGPGFQPANWSISELKPEASWRKTRKMKLPYFSQLWERVFSFFTRIFSLCSLYPIATGQFITRCVWNFFGVWQISWHLALDETPSTADATLPFFSCCLLLIYKWSFAFDSLPEDLLEQSFQKGLDSLGWLSAKSFSSTDFVIKLQRERNRREFGLIYIAPI